MQTERETGSGRPAAARRSGAAFRLSIRSRQSAACPPGPQRRRVRNTVRRSRAAFTLVELMVVIAIIAILAGLLMPAIGSALNRAHESSTLNLIHQCEIAATGFFNDHGVYPPSTYLEMFSMLNYDPNGDGTDRRLYDDPLDADGYIDFGNAAVFPHPATPGPTTRASRSSWPVWPPGTAAPTCSPATRNWATRMGIWTISPATWPPATNWYFGASDLLEVVDWWGNPLDLRQQPGLRRYRRGRLRAPRSYQDVGANSEIMPGLLARRNWLQGRQRRRTWTHSSSTASAPTAWTA